MTIGLLIVCGIVLTLIFPPAGILLTGFGILWFGIALAAKLIKMTFKGGARAASAAAKAARSDASPT